MKIFRVRGRVIFTIMLLLIVLTMFIISFQYKPTARLVPLIVGGVTAVLLIIALVGEAYPRLLKILDVRLVDYGESGESQAGKKEDETKSEGKKFLRMLVWIFSYCLLVFLVGFIAAMGIWMLIFTRFHGKMSWFKSVVPAIVTSGLIIVIFQVGMSIELFKGILFGAILPPF